LRRSPCNPRLNRSRTRSRVVCDRLHRRRPPSVSASTTVRCGSFRLHGRRYFCRGLASREAILPALPTLKNPQTAVRELATSPSIQLLFPPARRGGNLVPFEPPVDKTCKPQDVPSSAMLIFPFKTRGAVTDCLPAPCTGAQRLNFLPHGAILRAQSAGSHVLA